MDCWTLGLEVLDISHSKGTTGRIKRDAGESRP